MEKSGTLMLPEKVSGAIRNQLTSLKRRGIIKGFRLSSLRLDKGSLKASVVLNTKTAPRFSLLFSPQKREGSIHPVLTGGENFRETRFLVMNASSSPAIIASRIESAVVQRYWGHHHEDVVFQVLLRLENLPESIVLSARRGTYKEDKGEGKDFVLQVLYSGKRFEVFFDLKSSYLAQSEARKKFPQRPTILVQGCRSDGGIKKYDPKFVWEVEQKLVLLAQAFYKRNVRKVEVRNDDFHIC